MFSLILATVLAAPCGIPKPAVKHHAHHKAPIACEVTPAPQPFAYALPEAPIEPLAELHPTYQYLPSLAPAAPSGSDWGVDQPLGLFEMGFAPSGGGGVSNQSTSTATTRNSTFNTYNTYTTLNNTVSTSWYLYSTSITRNVVVNNPPPRLPPARHHDTRAPELDPSGGVGALALLVGLIAVYRGRSRNA